jgi:uncharacterized protein GlcG (DUF336 family)
MATITLRKARTIVSKALAKGREAGMKPLAVCVLDAGGHLKAFASSPTDWSRSPAVFWCATARAT